MVADAAARRIPPAVSDVRVHVLTSQEEVSFSEARVDVAVFFGPGHWADCVATPLFPEVVVPVCAPALLQGKHVAESADWMSLPSFTSTRPGRAGG